MRLRSLRALLVAGLLALASAATTTVLSAVADDPSAPNFGPKVHIFNSGMGQAAIQSQVEAIAAVQVNNQFGSQRDAILFEPGTYGTAVHPLNFQVGYYTSVAGLGQSPGDVVLSGLVLGRNVFAVNGCTGLGSLLR